VNHPKLFVCFFFAVFVFIGECKAAWHYGHAGVWRRSRRSASSAIRSTPKPCGMVCLFVFFFLQVPCVDRARRFPWAIGCGWRSARVATQKTLAERASAHPCAARHGPSDFALAPVLAPPSHRAWRAIRAACPAHACITAHVASRFARTNKTCTTGRACPEAMQESARARAEPTIGLAGAAGKLVVPCSRVIAWPVLAGAKKHRRAASAAVIGRAFALCDAHVCPHRPHLARYMRLCNVPTPPPR